MTSSYKTITTIIARATNRKNATVLTWSVDLSEELNHSLKASTIQKPDGICLSTYTPLKNC